MKKIAFLLFPCFLFAAVTVSNIRDTSLTLSWDGNVDFIQDQNGNTIATGPTSPLLITGLLANTVHTFTLYALPNEESVTVKTTHSWSGIMGECLGITNPTKAQLESVSSFTCSSVGKVNFENICDLQNVQEIRMSGNVDMGGVPSCIGELEHLRYLKASGSDISGMIPSTIGELASLEYLDLSANSITKIPDEIGSLINLKELHLAANKINQEIPETIGGLINVERIYLQDNRLQGGLPENIGNLTKLKKLRLDYNHLKGEIPESWVNLNLTQPSGLALQHNCRIFSDSNTTMAWVDAKSSFYGGYDGMVSRGGRCWNPAIVPIIMYLLD